MENNNKPVILFDFDDTKFGTLEMIAIYINETYGIKSVLTDYQENPDYSEVIKKYLPQSKHYLIIRDEVYRDLGENLLASVAKHQDILPIVGVTEILPALAERYEIYTVTARQHSSLDVIRFLLDKYVPNCVSHIHCVHRYNEADQIEIVSKREFIQSIQKEKVAFVDDSPQEILRVQDIVTSYLFDPHFSHEHRDEILNRVRSWEEIGQKLLSL